MNFTDAQLFTITVALDKAAKWDRKLAEECATPGERTWRATFEDQASSYDALRQAIEGSREHCQLCGTDITTPSPYGPHNCTR